jgi:Tfp pilus assembly protein PilN
MIKINLLGVAPPPTKAAVVGGPPATKATQVLMVVASLIVCLGIVGVTYKIWSNQIADLEKRRTQEKVRQTELGAVKTQNAQYQQRLKDYETRVKSIEALQASRVGPVELMTALGNAVDKTTDVYLSSMATTGDRIELKGQSGTVESMANFLAYMKNSGSFTDVQLELFFEDDVKDQVSYKFTLSCQFVSLAGGASPTAGAAPGAGSGGPGEPGTPPPGTAQRRATM